MSEKAEGGLSREQIAGLVNDLRAGPRALGAALHMLNAADALEQLSALQSLSPEREAVIEECARVCESHVGVSMLCDTPVVEAFYSACNKCADAIRALKPAAGNEGMVRVSREKLEDIISAIDRGLGDTDITHLETDDEIKEQAPIQWACTQLSLLLAAALSGGRS